MSTERDMTHIVRSWLRTDEHESADRVLDSVIALLDTTPQRRSRWPARRFVDMNTYAKLAIAAAAVVVVAIVGITMLPARGGVGGVGPSASPSPSLSPSPSPSPPPDASATPAAVFPAAGLLAVGRHAMTLNGVPFTFDVPTAGWTSNGQFALGKTMATGPTDKSFIFWTETPVGVFTDPCAQLKGPAIGSSAADLAAAVATVPGTDLVSGPTDVTVGGKPAKQVVLTVREDVDCVATNFYLWYAPSADLARYATALGSTIMTWIVDVDGKIVWIDGETYKGAGPEPGRQLQQIVDSIRFE
jgi:hypothetical protein